jgi:hypothetical protein
MYGMYQSQPTMLHARTAIRKDPGTHIDSAAPAEKLPFAEGASFQKFRPTEMRGDNCLFWRARGGLSSRL